MPLYEFVSRCGWKWDQHLSLSAYDHHKAKEFRAIVCPNCGGGGPKIVIHAVPSSIDGPVTTGPFNPDDVTSVPELSNCTFKSKRAAREAHEAMGIIDKGESAPTKKKKKKKKSKKAKSLTTKKAKSLTTKEPGIRRVGGATA